MLLKNLVDIKKNLQNKFDESEATNNQLQRDIDELRNQLNDFENTKNRLEHERDMFEVKFIIEQSKITGIINAKVVNDLIFNADIYLQEKSSQLDTSKSKYIVSTSNAKELGTKAYENGIAITSLRQTTFDFGAKEGTYYIRALIVNRMGYSVELQSNPITTNGSSLLFNYIGREENVILLRGQYKLEVWGASGGSSIGNRENSSAPGSGGLGGYSTGHLTLPEWEKLYIIVGGEGKSADTPDGSETNGPFPDGGGTKTGHRSGCTSVPGTGGGSTSICISSCSPYARVIVAGGGGGAGGDSYCSSNGGHGGGPNGGNCLHGSFKDQGAGTLTSSSPGFGAGSAGSAGIFGKGATGLYKQGCNSGGGGGGGWYGGGSGRYGSSTHCSGGGGGSGWVFTEPNFNMWKPNNIIIDFNNTAVVIDFDRVVKDNCIFKFDRVVKYG